MTPLEAWRAFGVVLKCAACCGVATCIGVYETPNGDIEAHCDDCCGHGNEDGWCKGLSDCDPVQEAQEHGQWIEREWQESS